jgi:hypothetical protein
MAVKFLGYEVNGQPQPEPPPELIERVRQAFQAEYDLQPAEKNKTRQTKGE